jgi:hypothetical protein
VTEIEQDMFEEEQPQQQPESGSSSDDEPLYKERKFNFMSEFAVVVEYGVIEKVMYLL